MTKADTDLDALFTLPLADFTAARNALVKRLKQSEHSDEAAKVMALTKPSISAWAVNQLYWKHRNEFDRLLAEGATPRRRRRRSSPARRATCVGPWPPGARLFRPC